MKTKKAGLIRFSLIITIATFLFSLAVVGSNAAEKEFVKGYVTQGDKRYDLSNIVVLRDGPTLQLLFMDKEMPEGNPRDAFFGDLLDGKEIKAVKIIFGIPGTELDKEGSTPLNVFFLPGDGTYRYQTGGTPEYEFKPEEFSSKV